MIPNGNGKQVAFIGESAAAQNVRRMIQLIAKRETTILIIGETGTGKEVVAKLIHQASQCTGLFVGVNCAGIAETLIETELFGHEKGAFTDAKASRIGRLEAANHGTIFLDEIGEMPMHLQPKLLRVIQEREFQRVGGTETISVRARLLTATNRNLEERVRDGQFREDLFYRLNVFPIVVPPLRERREDIPLLARHFVNGSQCQISEEVMSLLFAYSWPGNVRQLQNVIERAVILAGNGETIKPEHICLASGVRSDEGVGLAAIGIAGFSLDAYLNSIERRLIEKALETAKGNQTKAAEILGMKRTTLSAKLKVHGLP